MAVPSTQKQLPQAPAFETPDKRLESVIEKVVLQGNLNPLSSEERVLYYRAFCKYLGLDPISRPFDILVREGKASLYPNKNCAEQLNKKYDLSHSKPDVEIDEQHKLIIAWTSVEYGGGLRSEPDCGVVPTVKYNDNGQAFPLVGQELANAYKKAVTQAKRRSTLSAFGLSGGDEQEDMQPYNAALLSSEGIINVEIEEKPQEAAPGGKDSGSPAGEAEAGGAPAKRNGKRGTAKAAGADPVVEPVVSGGSADQGDQTDIREGISAGDAGGVAADNGSDAEGDKPESSGEAAQAEEPGALDGDSLEQMERLKKLIKLGKPEIPVETIRNRLVKKGVRFDSETNTVDGLTDAVFKKEATELLGLKQELHEGAARG